MTDDAVPSNDLGGCRRCGGRLTATHMLTKTYRVDEAGHWRRRLDDFIEDVVVVCAACGDEPRGQFQACAGTFTFVPESARNENEGAG